MGKMQAQFTETFSDGDFNALPEWTTGNNSDWRVNEEKELQSNNTNTGSVMWISTPNQRINDTEWTIRLRLEFNPSSVNYTDIYLAASQSDISNPAVTGYFIRIGNSEDEIALYRKDAGSTIQKLIDGKNGVLNNSSNNIRLKIIRDNTGKWVLFYSLTTSGELITEGTATDLTYSNTAWFGLLVKQSTSSFFQKHFFDDIEVKPFIPDVNPPLLLNSYYNTDTALTLLFDEPTYGIQNNPLSSFEINHGIGNPVSIVAEENEVRLSYKQQFSPGVSYTLQMPQTEDIWGNKQPADSILFMYYPPAVHDLLITEIMADPSPPKGLPDAEWIEIRNCSKRVISLKDWYITDNGGKSKAFPKIILYPDSNLIVTGSISAKQMLFYGKCLSIEDFPSLNNDADGLILTNERGEQIHYVPYRNTWYNNAVKSDGGWSLEMIDIKNPCGAAANWSASIHPSGGTPGRGNSIKKDNPDNESPYLLRAFAIDSTTVRLSFNETIDSISSLNPASYLIDQQIGYPLQVQPEGPSFHTIKLLLSVPLHKEKEYQVKVKDLADCSGNRIGNFDQASFGLTKTSEPGDIIVNEILFDPKGFGSDYIELYNRSSKKINLRTVMIANRSQTGEIGDKIVCSKDDYAFQSGSYAVICAATKDILFQYPAHKKESFFEVAELPSYPNDKGCVLVLNNEGTILDELSYSDDWHFPLLPNKEGVSLERIDPDAPTQQKENWTSAAEDIGFGTPGMQNSQFRSDLQVQGNISAVPEIFSPDQDGQDDFVTIGYQFNENGYVLNCKVFDAGGRVVRHLQRNLLCGRNGFFRWDGLSDKQQRLSVGPYLIFTEVFHLSGTVKRYVSRVVLASKRQG